MMDMVITGLSALLAGLTFVVIALPLMARTQKRDHYNDMINRRKKDLFDASRHDQVKKITTGAARTTDFSAKSHVETFFKVKKMMGTMADDLRDRLVQAGYRNASAPLVFVMLRICIPLGFVALCMLFFGLSEREISRPMMALVMMGGALFGFVMPGILLKNQMLKRQAEINITFPDALDMMLVCVQGGISLEQAVNRIAEEVSDHSETLAEELGVLGAELGLLNDRRRAFQDFAKRVGSGTARSFATAMIQAEQYGTSISSALRVMADELRDMRMAEAERKAAALPPKLTVPMILFFLPALFIVILGPAGIQAAKAMHGG